MRGDCRKVCRGTCRDMSKLLRCGTLNVMPLDIYSSIVFDMLPWHVVS